MKSVPYAPTVGSLMYVMVATRPDISHVVGVVSRSMHNPGRSHWNAVKHVFRYLAGTKDHDILFCPNSTLGVVGYTDSDFAGCVDSRKSTTGYCFKFGNGAISWNSKLQECTTTSTTEAEYVAVRRNKRGFMARSACTHVSASRLWLGSSCLQRKSWCCCFVEKSGSSQCLQAYRRSISLRSGLRHFRENRFREDIHNR